MKVTFIGTGNCILDPNRSMPCIAISQEDNSVHLVDIGSGAIGACIQLGYCLFDIKSVLITHFHVDHVLDLIHLLWLRKIHRSVITDPLFIYGPSGLTKFVSNIGFLFESISKEEACIQLNEVKSGDSFKTGGITAEVFSTYHLQDSIGFKFSNNGKTVAITGDTGICHSVINALKDVAVAIVECSFEGKSPAAVHMGSTECALLAEKTNPGTVVLTHLPAGINYDKIVHELESKYKGKIIIAEDFMQLDI